ncbi:MAG: iron-sulfur cluster assembly protein [Bacteroidetes bacterium]|nr:iron-sulfur cluster assembly protein [Bacteroidota bacterium]
MSEIQNQESQLNGIDIILIQEEIVNKIKTCFDPEIPVNIYELGLIYIIDVKPTGDVDIKMTLTSPMCPAAQSLPIDVKEKTMTVKDVKNVNVEVVWEPRWSPSMMTEEARLTLNM